MLCLSSSEHGQSDGMQRQSFSFVLHRHPYPSEQWVHEDQKLQPSPGCCSVPLKMISLSAEGTVTSHIDACSKGSEAASGMRLLSF